MSDRPDRFDPAHRNPVDYCLDRYRHLTPAQRGRWERKPAKALRRVLAEWNAAALAELPAHLVRDDIRCERIGELVLKRDLGEHEALELDRLSRDHRKRKDTRRARQA